MRLVRQAWLAVFATTAQIAQLATAQTASGQALEAALFDLPLIFNGRFVGDVRAAVSPDGQVQISTREVTELLKERLVRDASELQELARRGEWLNVDGANVGRLAISYDPREVQVLLSAPPELLRLQLVDLLPEEPEPQDLAAPSWFALGASVFASQQFVHEADGQERAGAQPVNASIDAFMNFGGYDGVYLLAAGRYEEDADQPFRRGDVTAVYDLPKRAIRFSAGDVRTNPVGFQNGATLGGLAVERLYEDLQPSRNFRATGRNQFTLTEDSLVEVLVNGVPVQTLRLGQGSYDFRNLPFFDGLNDFAVAIVDDSGRREIVRQSLFFNSTLLDEGVTLFGLSAGVPQNIVEDEIEYGSDPAITAYVQRGMSRSLTLGANLQADAVTQALGADAILASRFGTVSLEVAGSANQDHGSDFAGRVSYLWQGLERLGRPIFELTAEHVGARFSRVGAGAPNNSIEQSYTARYEQRVFGGVQFRLAAAQITSRDSGERRLASVGASRTFGRFTLFASFDREEGDVRSEDRALVSLSMRLGGRSYARARYNSLRNEYRAEYQVLSLNQLEEISGRIEYGSQDDEQEAFGEVELRSNRFRARVAHEHVTDPTTSRVVTNETRYDVGVGFGFAGGKFAVGRPVDQGFLIVDRQDAIEQARVRLKQGLFSTRTRGRSDMFGPILVPVERPYQLETLSVGYERLAPEIAPALDQIRVLPGARSGYAVALGEDRTISALGVLVDGAGKPIELLTGTLTPQRRSDAPIEFFTNRSGRLFASGLKPGRYVLRVDGQPGEASIEIARDARGVVDLGEVRLQ